LNLKEGGALEKEKWTFDSIAMSTENVRRRKKRRRI